MTVTLNRTQRELCPSGLGNASRVRILAWSNSEYEFLHQRFETFHGRPKHVYSQAEMPTMPAASPSSTPQ